MGVSQSDLYQAVAYGLKHNCKNIILLYPAHLIHLENGDPFVVSYEEKEINIFIRTFELNQNLQKEKQKLIDQLSAICSCI
jgi:5-methylcytosine-specific restriction endonuclease McrBC regulatory subunit McrC